MKDMDRDEAILWVNDQIATLLKTVFPPGRRPMVPLYIGERRFVLELEKALDELWRARKQLMTPPMGPDYELVDQILNSIGTEDQ